MPVPPTALPQADCHTASGGSTRRSFEYRSRPNWETYAELLRLARAVRKDLRDLHPRDMIDIQSFLWVQGSDEYPDRG
jgi:hypothetical protein